MEFLDPFPILTLFGLSDVVRVERVTGGADALLWRVEAGGMRSALRLLRPEQAPVMRREVEAMHLASTAGLPVPRVRAEGMWQGRPAMLMDWCEGRTLMEELRARPEMLWPLGEAFGRAQARLHAVTVPADTTLETDAWVEWAGEDEQALQERLRDTTRGRTLLHLDFHPLNVLFAGDRPSGIIDWTNVSVGDPRADLARTAAVLRLAFLGPALPHVAEVASRRMLERAWRVGYSTERNWPEDMAPFHAWAGAALIRDLTPRPGRTVGLEGANLLRALRWVAWWKRRAGLFT